MRYKYLGFRPTVSVLVALLILLILPITSLLTSHLLYSQAAPEEVLENYLTAIYTRDYSMAYQWISSEDRKIKSKTEFLRENPSFSGNTLRLVRGLANYIETSNFKGVIKGGRTTFRFRVRLPDASDTSLQKILLGFDPDQIARLSENEIQSIEKQIHTLAKGDKLPTLEGEESLELVKEREGWRVFLNWAGATRVLFEAAVKNGLPWSFEPVQDSISAQPGETLHAIYRAKNLSDHPITAKARHLDEPKDLAAKYLEIVQCFCFIQQTLAPGEEKELPLVFRVNWNVPKEVKEFRVSYEFYPIDKFPEN